MEDGATKTTLAGSCSAGGVEMIRSEQGGHDRDDRQQRRMGAVMSRLGQKRQFKLTLNEIKDATQGLTIAFTSALLPTMQRLASAMQVTAESVNTLRLSMQAIVEFVESGVVLVGITLFVKWTTAIGTFIAMSGGLIATIEAIGAAITAAFVANPATAWIALISAALYSAYLVWKSYPPEVDKATEAHKRLTDEIKKMKPEEQKQKIDVYTAAIADMRHEIEDTKATMEAQRSFGDTFGVEESKKKIDEMIVKLNDYRFYLGLLKTTAAKGIATPVIADPGVIDTLKKKMIELKASFADFGPPMEKSRAAFKATLDAIVEGKGPIELYKKEIDALIAKHNEYIATETKLKVYVANVAGDLQKSVSHWDSYLNDLEIDYSNGLVDLSDYYEERKRVIAEKTQAEITALQKERAMATTSTERKVAIGIEIQVKGEQLDAALKKETDAGEKAAKALADSIRVGELQSLIDTNTIDLVTLENQFSGGLMMIGDFYDRRRAIIEEEAGKKISNITATLPGLDPAEAEKARQQIASIRAQATADLLKMDNDQRAADAKLVSDTISTTAMIAQVRADGAADGYEAMMLQGEARLELLKQKDLDEIEQLSATLAQKTDAEMSFNEKRQAMEDLYAAQDRRRKQTTVDIERQIDQTRLQNYMGIAASMGQIFGQLYDMGGKKMKVFFYIQKAMSIAQITMQAAIAAMSALAPPPVGLGPIGGQGLAARGRRRCEHRDRRRADVEEHVEGRSVTSGQDQGRRPRDADAGRYVRPGG
jgi:hypothetical protein